MYNSPYNNYGGVPNYQMPQVQQYTAQPTPPQGLKGHPVSSLDEARVANIDFDGSLFLFPDIVNKKIYTKQINLDGTASFNIYSLTQEPVEETPEYVTKDEFDKVLGEIKDALKQATPQPAINF